MNQLSIVLPCYNPPDDWEQHVSEAYAYIARHLKIEPELVIVNDGSSKNIDADLEQLTTKVPGLIYIALAQNKGKGAALRAGVAKATGKLVIYTDIDFPYTLDSFLAVFEALNTGNYDIAIGIKNEDYYRYSPKYRTFISKVLRKGIGFFFNMPVTDTQCGLKGFNPEGKAVFLETTIDRYLFDLEFVYQSFRKYRNLKVKAIAVRLRPNVIFRAMNLKVLASESTNFLKILLKRHKK
ncbi:MAG: glycosyltransferase [Sphingobacteriales bacterium]|nr:MAG: glycosyltransferase [Sphingobacteriales bacterium]